MAFRFVQDRTSAMRIDYNDHSEIQRGVLGTAGKFIERGVDLHSAKLPEVSDEGATPNSFITIADFGCSTGSNSSLAVSLIIEGLRAKYGKEMARYFQVVHNDLSSNSWTTVFDYIHSNADSYLRKLDGVFAVASGLSFYHQILPPNSLHFGFSNYSLHWLSHLPVKLSHHCTYQFGTAQEQEAFRAAAAQDWRDFLTARAAELVRGGVLVLHVLTMRQRPIHLDTIYQSAKKLLERGFITEAELENFNLPMYFRTLPEITEQALMDELGLQIVTAEQIPQSPHALAQSYQVHQDLDRFAAEFAAHLAVVADGTFTSALGPSRDRQFLTDVMWQEYRQVIKKRPMDFWSTSGHLFLILRKN